MNRNPGPPSPQASSRSTPRLVGLDVARALAVLGMFAAHTAPGSWLYTIAEGRAAALFAVLAGVSIALMSGGSQPSEGSRLRAARVLSLIHISEPTRPY